VTIQDWFAVRRRMAVAGCPQLLPDQFQGTGRQRLRVHLVGRHEPLVDGSGGVHGRRQHALGRLAIAAHPELDQIPELEHGAVAGRGGSPFEQPMLAARGLVRWNYRAVLTQQLGQQAFGRVRVGLHVDDAADLAELNSHVVVRKSRPVLLHGAGIGQRVVLPPLAVRRLLGPRKNRHQGPPALGVGESGIHDGGGVAHRRRSSQRSSPAFQSRMNSSTA